MPKKKATKRKKSPPKNPAKTMPYPVRLDGPMKADISATSALVGLPFPETMRQAIKFGLPVLCSKFSQNVQTHEPQSVELKLSGLSP